MKNNITIAVLALHCLGVVLVNNALAANPPTNADELVAQHLDSIASPAVRAGLKSRVAQGPVHFTILVGGAGNIDGKAVVVSEGNKLQFMIKLPNNEYRGEQFIFNGEKDSVAFSSNRQTRSSLGNFVLVQDAVVREGLVGGVLSTAWPLLNLEERKPKLSFDGLKKVDGQELYALRYRPRKNSDLEIILYFDPQTYRHVETTYSLTSSEDFANFRPSTAVGLGPSTGGRGGTLSGSTLGVGTAETAAARQFQNRYRLRERFGEFKTVDGVTLPTQDNIEFSQELQNGHTTLWEWAIKGLEVSNNIGIDARAFEVK
ncbi:MAG: hypothetical protein ACLP0H_02725 [Terriglobales bacterium]